MRVKMDGEMTSSLSARAAACVTGGWMMQIEDNISAIVNGITPNVMSLKGWVLAAASAAAVWS